jgi:hypothetical protein
MSEPHIITRLWPSSHEAFKLAKENPYIKCSCGWKYEIQLSTIHARYDGVDCVNELLDYWNNHVVAVKNKWGKYDE